MSLHHLEALSLAHTEFAQRLARVGDDQWSLPTPCAEWDVRELVHHVVGGYQLYLDRLDGARDDGVVRWNMPDGLAEVEQAFFSLGDQFEERFGNPGILESTSFHPAFGQITGNAVLSLRIFDMTIHAWDLARALGLPEELNPKLVSLIWEQWEPSADAITAGLVLGPGPSGTLDVGTPLQTRLLDLVGRRP